MESEFLAHNLFGFQINELDFRKRLAFFPEPRHSILNKVTIRMRFVDLVRFRLHYRQSFFLNGGLPALLVDIEKEALELYLLCTCIDVLSGADFIEFQNWLTTKNKAKHHIDDDKIRQIIGTDASTLSDPDYFRKTAHKVYEEAYLPIYGNQKGFVRFFDTLPTPIKKILAEAYFISDRLDSKILSEDIKDSTQIPTYYISLRTEEEKWGGKSLDDKTRLIGTYFYQYRRNAYTHNAEGWKPQVFNDPNKDDELKPLHDPNMKWRPMERILTEKDNKFRFFRFQARHSEDEALLVRLVVAAGILSELDYKLDDEYVEGFRQYLMYRKSMYDALNELTEISSVIGYYEFDKEEPLLLYDRKQLPIFPFIKLKGLLPYFNVHWPNHVSWLETYIQQLEEFNSLINEFNIELAKLYNNQNQPLSLEQSSMIQKSRGEAFAKFHLHIIRGHFKVSSEVRIQWINENADRMIW